MQDPPASVVDVLEDASDETLKATIAYCRTKLEDEEPESDTEDCESEPPEEFEGDEQQWADAVADSEAPGRATLTTKEIKGNRYLYWQWSEDGKTKSEYIAPKSP